MPLCEAALESECPQHGTVKGCEPEPVPAGARYTEEFVRYAIIAADIQGWKRGRVIGPHPGSDRIVRNAKRAGRSACRMTQELQQVTPGGVIGEIVRSVDAG